MSTQLAVPGASLHVKAGALAHPPVLTLKANLRPDAGDADGAVLVFDLAEHALEAILASGDLTAMRTAAVAATAAQALTKPGHDAVVAIIGAGPLAQYVDQALAYLGLAGELRVWSRSKAHAQQLVDHQANSQKTRRVCSTIASATADADLVVTCTPARTPLIQADDLAPHAVVLAMGADSPGKRELGEGVLDSALLVADVPSNALAVGEFAQLADAAAARVDTLGSLLAGGLRPNHVGRTIFDSVGSSAVDAAVAAMVVDRAVADGLGSALAF